MKKGQLAISAQVIDLRSQGKSFGMIMAELGLTKGQVAGICGRAREMGLLASTLPPVRAREATTVEPAPEIIPQAPSAPAPRVTSAPPTANGCRWIEGFDYLDRIRAGENIFCGEPATGPGESWCAEHRARCFAKHVEAA